MSDLNPAVRKWLQNEFHNGLHDPDTILVFKRLAKYGLDQREPEDTVIAIAIAAAVFKIAGIPLDQLRYDQTYGDN